MKEAIIITFMNDTNKKIENLGNLLNQVHGESVKYNNALSINLEAMKEILIEKGVFTDEEFSAKVASVIEKIQNPTTPEEAQIENDGPEFDDGPEHEGFAERCGENEEEVPGGASVKTTGETV